MHFFYLRNKFTSDFLQLNTEKLDFIIRYIFDHLQVVYGVEAIVDWSTPRDNNKMKDWTT